MFGSKRKKATKAAIESLRPLISLGQMSGGMSTLMWHDPYLLGYMNFTASFYAKVETNGKASAADIGYALQDAFTSVSNMNGLAITKEVVRLHETQDADFSNGMSDAATIAFYSAGVIEDEEQHILVVQCKENVCTQDAALINGDKRSAVSGEMMRHTFVRRVKALNGDYNA